MERLAYPHSPLSSIRALSGLLQIPEKFLIDIATNRDKYYKQNKPQPKSGGGVRITYRLDEKLKFIQRRIKSNIFNLVTYPNYLQGSIKDTSNPRTYDRDAAIHATSHFIISEDVSDFFHSIDEKYVMDMWKYLFHFSVDVSELLTRLTTYKGYVPQGGVTSSYLANLVLWDIETELVIELNRIGLTYTRYVDDITLSARINWLSQSNLEKAIKLIYVMLAKKGIRPNRKKHKIMSKSVRMTVHKLTINSGRPTMDKKRRNKIRLEVFNLKKFANACGRKSDEYQSQFNSVTGKVRELLKFHPSQGEKYLDQLLLIRPK